MRFILYKITADIASVADDKSSTVLAWILSNHFIKCKYEIRANKRGRNKIEITRMKRAMSRKTGAARVSGQTSDKMKMSGKKTI